MRAISQTRTRARKRRSKAAAGFSLKPVAVLLCAALLVRVLYMSDAGSKITAAVSQWQPGGQFTEIAMFGAGLPVSSDGGSVWVSLLSGQTSALGELPEGGAEPLPPASDEQAPVNDAEEPEEKSYGAMKLPAYTPVFSRSFWSFDDDDMRETVPSDAMTNEQVLLPEDTPVDDRVIPTPVPGDPNAKKVLEVTLTSPSGVPDGVYINNKTKYAVSAQDMLSKTSSLKVSDASKPQVLIIHTHGTESFLPDERDYYVPTDIERTEDTRYNVVRLGDEMEKELSALGLNVLHDRNIYDSPSYNGSYGRSLKSIEQYMKDYPSIQVVIDIHRDSISASDGSMYKTVSSTEKGKAAQMMIVVGSDGSGLTHPNWKQNLAFACDIDKAVLDKYPTLMRSINLRNERFNQHATTGSIILEVGTAGNTLSEALLSIQLFCETAGARLAEQLLQ